MPAVTYLEFQRRLGKAGLSVREFAHLIQMNPNSITNCSRKGEVPAHLAVIITLMAEMAEHGVDFRNVLAKVDIERKEPRGGASKGRFGGNRQPDMFMTAVPNTNIKF